MNKVLCKCGCGQKVKLLGSRFCQGHYNKTAEVKKKHSESLKGRSVKLRVPREIRICPICGKEIECRIIETRKFCSKSCGAKGKPGWMLGLTKETDTRIKASVEKRKITVKGMFKGKNNSFYGRHHSGESKKKMGASVLNYNGSNNPNWRGGLSNSPYPSSFDEKLRSLIRERDGDICQLCSMTEEENRRKLTVHHIDYIKENLDPKNLITLCCSCNGKANANRKNWTRFFQLKLKIG